MMRFIVGVAGIILGFSMINISGALNLIKISNISWVELSIKIGFPFLIGIIFYLFSYKIIGLWKRLIQIIENELQKVPFHETVLGTMGLIIGLLIANLFSKPLDIVELPYLGFIIRVILNGLLGYFGILIFTRKKEEIFTAVSNVTLNIKSNKDKFQVFSNNSCPKILDTSVIIDGRIADICKAGFLEGPFIISKFVLVELQNIADSSDDLRRDKGRRGLDILNKIQKELGVEIIINEEKFEDIGEVDSKLLRLTQLLNGKIVTNDYNLSKVAEVQGIEVLNINELSNAIKPVVLPGEGITAFVMKDGKERDQGLAYLDDGTMIVVELGRKYIGETIDVVVTSALQTTAGKIIFAKPKMIIEKAV
jgi:uncharacterized protein YacL